MRRFRSAGFCIATMAMVSPALAAEGMTELVEMLKCEQSPEPTAALRKMADQGLLPEDKRDGIDSAYCWDFEGNIVIGEVEFGRICASNEDPQAVAANPDLFWRGPGTSPGTGITFVSAARLATVEAWAAEFAPKAHVQPSNFYTGEVEVSCNSLAF